MGGCHMHLNLPTLTFKPPKSCTDDSHLMKFKLTSAKEITLELQNQTPLSFLAMDFMKEILRIAHAFIDQCGDEMQNYTISIGKVYDHWACQLNMDS
jgi:hypothetical protein